MRKLLRVVSVTVFLVLVGLPSWAVFPESWSTQSGVESRFMLLMGTVKVDGIPVAHDNVNPSVLAVFVDGVDNAIGIYPLDDPLAPGREDGDFSIHSYSNDNTSSVKIGASFNDQLIFKFYDAVNDRVLTSVVTRNYYDNSAWPTDNIALLPSIDGDKVVFQLTNAPAPSEGNPPEILTDQCISLAFTSPPQSGGGGGGCSAVGGTASPRMSDWAYLVVLAVPLIWLRRRRTGK